jgi:hypothetical protein
VIATQTYNDRRFLIELIGCNLDLRNRLFDIVGITGNIPGIGNLYRLEGFGIIGWMKISA